MADIHKPGTRLPEWQRSRSLHGRVQFRTNGEQLVASAWPKKRGRPKSETTRQQNELFAASIRALPLVDPLVRVQAMALAENTAYTWRDILFMAMHGEYFELEGIEDMAISDQLDMISTTPGAMLYRAAEQWIAILPPSDDAVLVFDVATQLPYWTVNTAIAITELTGDVIAGPGVGSQVATLAETGVDPGTYLRANIEVDSKGRILAASEGTDAEGITELGGDVIAGPGSGTQAASLSETGVEPGSYGHASITVDAKGRIIDADVGAVATTSVAGTVIPDGTTIAVNGSGVISATAGGSAGTGGVWPGSLPPVPTVAGTGFTTWVNQGSAAINDLPAGIVLDAPTNITVENVRLVRKAVPSPPITIEARLGLNAQTMGAFANAIFGFSDGTQLWYAMISQRNSSPSPLFFVVRQATPSSALSVDLTGNTTVCPNPFWLRLVYTSTRIAFQRSIDGGQYYENIGFATASWYFTPTHIIFGVDPFNTDAAAALLSYREF